MIYNLLFKKIYSSFFYWNPSISFFVWYIKVFKLNRLLEVWKKFQVLHQEPLRVLIQLCPIDINFFHYFSILDCCPLSTFSQISWASKKHSNWSIFSQTFQKFVDIFILWSIVKNEVKTQRKLFHTHMCVFTGCSVEIWTQNFNFIYTLHM